MIHPDYLELLLRASFLWVCINLAFFTVLAYDTRKSQNAPLLAYLTKKIVITVDREVNGSIR